MQRLNKTALTAILLASTLSCSFCVQAEQSAAMAETPSTQESAPVASPPPLPRKLSVWLHVSNATKISFEPLAIAFEKKTGIHIEYFNALADFEQRLMRAANGHPNSPPLPDLIVDDAAMLGQLVRANLVAEIDRTVVPGNEDLYEIAWASVRATNGKYYALPFSAQVQALFIRKDWRTKLGMPVPKNRADIEALAKAFTEKDPDGNGKNNTFGLLLPGSPAHGTLSQFLISFIWQAGGDFIRPTSTQSGNAYKPSLDEPVVAETVKSVRALLCNKYTQPGALSATTADITPLFRTAQAGILLSGLYTLGSFDKDPGKDNYEVVALTSGPQNAYVLAEGSSIYLMKDSANQDAASMFMTFMISPEGQEIGMNSGSITPQTAIRLSVNKKVNTRNIYNDERLGLFQDIYAKQGKYAPNIPDWQAVRQISAEGFNRILSNCTLPVETGLKDLNAKLAEELTKQKVLAR